ncbi:MAG: LysR substrate-binding domain-containing protein, partial [Pseudomonadota bacterium]
NEIENGVEELEGLKGVDGGHIAIGAMPLSRARVLPSAIVEFKQTRPAAHISVAEGSYFELVEPLRNGELDFVIGALRDPPPGADLVQSELFEDLPVVVARRDHPLPERKGLVDIRKIAEYDWCIPKIGAPLRANWERMFSGPGLSIPNISVECGSVMTIRQILMGTNCLSLLSPDQFAVELDAGLLKIVGQAPDSTRRKIGVTHREGWRPTPLQDSFIATLKSVSSCSNRS